jgi:hypothetical protein
MATALPQSEKTPAAYAALRARVGSQAYVSKAFGIDISTLSRRENGDKEVATEAVLALKWLEANPLQPDEQANPDATASHLEG